MATEQSPVPTYRADVIVPVHGNLHAVRRCLESVVTTRGTALGRLLVVDDASPDIETRGYLDALAAQGEIELIRHAGNRGFVVSVNAGMAATDGDVVLLNSDTEVHGDWLERMLRCAYADERIGTVTPFSNNATICSYPWQGWGGELPGGVTLAQLDAMFARENAGAHAELPTGVGFCLLLRRACLDDIGFFDSEAFGRGYGEENDFCQRAILAGWKNMLCADTFVYHAGGASFGAEGESRSAAAERLLAMRYPDYPNRVRNFILADSLRPLRERVDLARARMGGRHGEHVVAERAGEKAWLLGWLGHLVLAQDRRASAAEVLAARAPLTSTWARFSSWLKRMVVR
jgi:GT2 family glycosyltransferase